MRRSAFLGIVVFLALAPAAGASRPVIEDEVLDADDRVAVHAPAAQAPAAAGVRAVVRGLLDRLGPDTGLPAPLADDDGKLDVYLTATSVGTGRDGPRPDSDGRTAYIVGPAKAPETLRSDLARAVARASLLGIDPDEETGWWGFVSLDWATKRLAGTPIADPACRTPKCLIGDVLAPRAAGLIPAVWERLRMLGAGNALVHSDAALGAELQARGLSQAAISAAVAEQPFADGRWRRAACILSSSSAELEDTAGLQMEPWTSQARVLRLGGCAPRPASAELRLTAVGELAADARAVAWREGQPPQPLTAVPLPGGGLEVVVPLDPLPDAVAIGIANASAGQRLGYLGYRWRRDSGIRPQPVGQKFVRSSCRPLPRRRQRCTLIGTATPTVRKVSVGLLRRLRRGRCVTPLAARGLRPRRCPAAGRRAPFRAAVPDAAGAWRLSVVLPRGRARWRLEIQGTDVHGLASPVASSTARIGR